MSIKIVETELPIEKHGIGECCNCKKQRHVRHVKIYSAFGGMQRGYYPLCFHCCGPVFRWIKTELKESDTYETPYFKHQYIEELNKLEPETCDM